MASGTFTKVCETLWLTWGFFVVGINYSALGPTFLDLQLFLKQDLATLSTIPLSSGIGETAGMVFTLWMSRFGHRRLQISVSLLLSSVIISIIPVTNSYIFVAVMFFLVGFISGIPSVFLMDVCSELWKDKGTTFQFILVGSSVGAILTPIIVQPFLCHRGASEILTSGNINFRANETNTLSNNVPEECLVDNQIIIQELCLSLSNGQSGVMNNSEQLNLPHNSNTSKSCFCTAIGSLLNDTNNTMISYDDVMQVITSNMKTLCGDNYSRHSTSEIHLSLAFFHNCCARKDSMYQCNSSYGLVERSTIQCTEKDTRVRTAYVMLGLILLPTSFAFFYYWWRRDSRWATDAITDIHVPLEDDKHNQGQLKVCIFYTLIFLSFLPATALTIVFGMFLTAFGVQAQLHLLKSTMVYMTSVFWFSTLIGRISSTLITSYVGHTKVIIGNFVGLIISGILLIFFAPYNVAMLWISTVLFGLFVCPYEGAGVAWAADHVGMSSKLVVLSWMSVSVGNLLFPFLGGIMFDNVGPTSFLYLTVGQIMLMVLVFGVMNISVKFLR